MICNSCKAAGELTTVLRKGGLSGEPVRVIISLHGQCTGCDCQHQVGPDHLNRARIQEAK